MTVGEVQVILSWMVELPSIVPSLFVHCPTRYLERHGYRMGCWGDSSRPPTRVMVMMREADAVRVAGSIGRGVMKARR